VTEQSASVSPNRWPIPATAVSMLFVIAGAILAFIALTADYFTASEDQSFGLGQIVMLLAGVGAIAAGYATDVMTGRRALTDVARLGIVIFELALLGLALKTYEIENRAFNELVFPIVALGFIVNDQLPSSLRLPFFFTLSVATIVAVLGVANPVACAWLIGLALGLFAICELPIRIIWRVALMIAAGLVLAAMRVGWLGNEAIASILPILGSMFIFRAAIYLYDVANGKGPKGLWQRLSYFFLLPNVVFPFFPVVDFTTFGRTYYNQDAIRIYQRGADWILRGTLHLLVYRFVYLHVVMAPEDVHSALNLLQFIAANFALYFRISGLFHLIIGMLLLFGFNLPETHTRFYFTSSFVDFWRRTNIYWKDFMQKMVFNPSYTQLKHWGITHQTSITISMLAVFAGTWALHSYQWFWLRGSVLFTLPDAMFWAILGVLLVGQTLWESKPRPSPRVSVLSGTTLHVARTVCSMLTICILWSLWTSNSVADWAAMWAASGLTPALASPAAATPAQWAATIVTILAVSAATAVTANILLPAAPAGVKPKSLAKTKAPTPWATIAGAGAAALLLAQTSIVQGALTADLRDIVRDMSSARLNARDQAMLTQGYYENLTDVNHFNTRLWEIYMQRPRATGEIRDMAAVRLRPDYMEYEFIPGATASFNGVTYTINRWGMRDRDTPQAKPPGTYRIALMGASRSVGWGVEYDQGFEPRLETLLNANPPSTGTHYEVLNFSVDGYVPVQRLIALDEHAWQFQPDAVIFEAGPPDASVGRFAHMAQMGRTSPYPEINAIIAAAGVTSGMEREEIERRLEPHRYELLGHIYDRFVAACRQHGITPIWLYIPEVTGDDESRTERFIQVEAMARRSGFAILDFSRVFADQSVDAVRIGSWDNHPNARGHAILAEQIYARLTAPGAALLQRQP